MNTKEQKQYFIIHAGGLMVKSITQDCIVYTHKNTEALRIKKEHIPQVECYLKSQNITLYNIFDTTYAPCGTMIKVEALKIITENGKGFQQEHFGVIYTNKNGIIKSITENGIIYTKELIDALRVKKEDLPVVEDYLKAKRITTYHIFKTTYAPSGTILKS